jgi:ribokinase
MSSLASPRITVIGSSNTDMILKLPRLPRPGETVLGGDYTSAAGGKGANQAVAAARLGARVVFVASVGADPLGDAAIAGFEREHIDTSQIHRHANAASGVALIFIDAAGENSIGVASGANFLLDVAAIQRAAPVIRDSAVVLMQLETPLPTITAAARLAAEAGCRVILNPAPAQPLPDDLLQHVAVLTPNEHEAEALTGVAVRDAASAARAASLLLAKGPRAVVITLGAAGAWLATRDDARLVPTFPVEAIDTTAAGDTFNGALAVALAENLPLENAVRFANAAAAIAVTRLGAQPSAPRRPEVEALLRDESR